MVIRIIMLVLNMAISLIPRLSMNILNGISNSYQIKNIGHQPMLFEAGRKYLTNRLRKK